MSKRVTTQRCRTCLKYSTKTFSLTKLVTGCTSDITYSQLLKEYAQFEYNPDYELHLPQYLCFLCCSQLKNTYAFIQQARHSNVKLISDLTKHLCLQEQVIDLPQLQDDITSISIKKENPDNHDDSGDQNSDLEDQVADLEDQDSDLEGQDADLEVQDADLEGQDADLGGHDFRNIIANEDTRAHEDNLVTNKSCMAELYLTTEEIIEYDDFEDDLATNKSFIAEPDLTTEEIIVYDFEDNMEMDTDNFSSKTNENTIVLNSKEDTSLSNKSENLESVESLLEVAPLHKQKPSSKEQIFICAKCPGKYNNKYEYLKHVKDKHNSRQAVNFEKNVENQNESVKIIKCQFCDFIGKTYSVLRYHNLSKHGTEDDKPKCKFCSYTSLNKANLLNHIKNVHNELIKTLKAKSISNTDESMNSNNNNSSTDNDNEQDKEEFSDEDFIRNIINMKKRPRKKLPTKYLVRRCEECDKIFKNEKTLRAHQRDVHKSEDMFSSCPHCDKKCKRETDLKIHIRQIHGPEEDRKQPKPRSKVKRFMCAECSYTCRTSTLLNIHVRLHHTGERPYKCDICSKSFIVAYNLRIHRYSHTGEKPFKCPTCLKSFKDPSYLRKHKRLHTNEKPYTCDDCGKGFTQSYNLSVHKRTHLKEDKLSCSVCGKFFKNKSMLNIHQINENHYNEVV